MHKKLLVLLALVATVFLSSCSLMPEQVDETKSWSAAKLYAEARNQAQTGELDKAIEYYEKLESRYPFGTYAQQAQMEVAYAHYRQDESDLALTAVERFIKLHPNHEYVDYMYYLRGLASFNDRVSFLQHFSEEDITERDPKAAQDAYDAFNLLIKRFPDSKYAPDSLARMKYLLNAMAIYEVHVARYYLRRGAYLAAANRAQSTVKKYPDSQATEEALFIMVSAYDKLGLTALRDDANRVYTKNFPDSVFAKGDVQEDDSPWWKIW